MRMCDDRTRVVQAFSNRRDQLVRIEIDRTGNLAMHSSGVDRMFGPNVSILA